MLALIDDAVPGARDGQLRAFELIFVLVVATGCWLRAVPKCGQLAAATAFLQSDRRLREFAPRDRFAAAVLTAQSEWDRVRLLVFRPAMDARTGTIVMRRAGHAHPRG